jgi:hypothetical protein
VTLARRFNPDEVLDLIADVDGKFDDGIDAFVSAHVEDGYRSAVVELTSTEENESERVTDRFRVTVERIKESR